jgi:hypothetical protein
MDFYNKFSIDGVYLIIVPSLRSQPRPRLLYRGVFCSQSASTSEVVASQCSKVARGFAISPYSGCSTAISLILISVLYSFNFFICVIDVLNYLPIKSKNHLVVRCKYSTWRLLHISLAAVHSIIHSRTGNKSLSKIIKHKSCCGKSRLDPQQNLKSLEVLNVQGRRSTRCHHLPFLCESKFIKGFQIGTSAPFLLQFCQSRK